MTTTLFLTLVALIAFSYFFGQTTAMKRAKGHTKALHSRPGYYGFYVALWCGIPSLLVLGVWNFFEPAIVKSLVVSAMPEIYQKLTPSELDLILEGIRRYLEGGDAATLREDAALMAAAERYKDVSHIAGASMVATILALAIASISWASSRITPQFRARNSVEKAVRAILIACSTIAILTTIGIVLSLVFESYRFFEKVSPTDFLFGLEWSPQTALRPDQVGSSGLFGSVPLLAGTMLISFLAMCVAAPVGLMAAIYMSEYAKPNVRTIVKPLLEILAGIPTVVYGFFAALTVAPFFRNTGEQFLGLNISSESALAAGAVMGIMIIPFVSSLSDDVISSVPQSMREGSLGLGATKSETIKQVILPAALPGIVGSILLAASRAIGETMIVVMAAGLAANLTANPLQAVTTVTVQIVTLLVGDQEFDSAKTLAAFALGLMLFCVTLCLNIIALRVVQKYREQYD